MWIFNPQKSGCVKNIWYGPYIQNSEIGDSDNPTFLEGSAEKNICIPLFIQTEIISHFILWGYLKVKVTAYNRFSKLDVLYNLPHSPDLPSRNFHLFAQLKEHLPGKQFATNGDMQTLSFPG
jgi:hypothetical protein